MSFQQTMQRSMHCLDDCTIVCIWMAVGEHGRGCCAMPDPSHLRLHANWRTRVEVADRGSERREASRVLSTRLGSSIQQEFDAFWAVSHGSEPQRCLAHRRLFIDDSEPLLVVAGF